MRIGAKVGRLLGGVIILVGGAACSSGTAPEERPTEARIEVLGSAPSPLELVTVTEFFESVEEGEVVQIPIVSDTLAVTPPFERTVALTDLGSIVVELTNYEEEPATVELRVRLDNGADPYSGSATMSEGGSLRYVFVFLRRLL